MPIDYSEYPDDWDERRARVLLRSAGSSDVPKCEHCGVPQYAVGYRDEDGTFVCIDGTDTLDLYGLGYMPVDACNELNQRKPSTYRDSKFIADFNNEHEPDRCDGTGAKWFVIVLTAAHLDRTGEGPDGPIDCPDDRLAALCQRCHLRLDAPRRAKQRAARMGIPIPFDT